MSIPETKICAKCGINKKAEEYTIVKIKRGKYNPHLMGRCKLCKAEDQKKHRKPYDPKYAKTYKENNKDKIKQWSKLSYIKRKKRWEDFMKQHKCSKCGISDYRVLQWHHLDASTKTMTIGANARQGKWDDILEEVKKCVCVCANCHFILHAEEQDSR